MEKELYSAIMVAENSNRIVKTAKQQIAKVMSQMPVYSGYYCMELSLSEGGTNYLESGECRIMKDLYNGGLYAANENWVPTCRLSRQDCVRVAMNLKRYNYGKRVRFRSIGKDMDFRDYVEVYVSSELHEFYSVVYNRVINAIKSMGGKYHSDTYGDFELVNSGVGFVDIIKWNDKHYVPCFPSVMSVDPFRYTSVTFLEKNSFVLFKIFDEIFSEK